MANENTNYAGSRIVVSVSKPFIDIETSEKSIMIRYYLEKAGSDELCFCDIQFPQEIVVNKHRMNDDEVEAMLCHYDKYCEDMWRIASELPDLDTNADTNGE